MVRLIYVDFNSLTTRVHQINKTLALFLISKLTVGGLNMAFLKPSNNKTIKIYLMQCKFQPELMSIPCPYSTTLNLATFAVRFSVQVLLPKC